MKLIALTGNSLKLDGGAMFGNVPKALWSQWLPPDEQNRIPLACRCLLVQDQGRNILLETGVGAFFEPKLRHRYGVQEQEHVLLTSLRQVGLEPSNIDYIILSHLHFDHSGGLLTPWSTTEKTALLFDKAIYITSKLCFERALNPHPRDRASFIPEINRLLQESGRLQLIEAFDQPLGQDFTFRLSHGHTPGLLITEIATNEGPLVFAADLIPGLAWIHIPVTMGYDRFAELVIDEKKDLLTYLAANNGRLFFTHDPEIAVAKITLDENNKFNATPEPILDTAIPAVLDSTLFVK